MAVIFLIPIAMYFSFLSKSFLGFLLLCCVGASTIGIPHVALEQREHAGSWIKRSRIPTNAVLPVRIALTQSNLENGEEHLMRV